MKIELFGDMNPDLISFTHERFADAYKQITGLDFKLKDFEKKLSDDLNYYRREDSKVNNLYIQYTGALDFDRTFFMGDTREGKRNLKICMSVYPSSPNEVAEFYKNVTWLRNHNKVGALALVCEHYQRYGNHYNQIAGIRKAIK